MLYLNPNSIKTINDEKEPTCSYSRVFLYVCRFTCSKRFKQQQKFSGR